MEDDIKGCFTCACTYLFLVIYLQVILSIKLNISFSNNQMYKYRGYGKDGMGNKY